jgi:uncharacterized protein
MRTARDLLPEEVAAYRAALRARDERDREALGRRRERAWELAREAAVLLRTEFRATRVVAYGSLVHPHAFDRWSDVDLAAWGIQSRDTWQALGRVLDLGGDIELNLTDVSMCRPEIMEVIEKEGIDL